MSRQLPRLKVYLLFIGIMLYICTYELHQSCVLEKKIHQLIFFPIIPSGVIFSVKMFELNLHGRTAGLARPSVLWRSHIAVPQSVTVGREKALAASRHNLSIQPHVQSIDFTWINARSFFPSIHREYIYYWLSKLISVTQSEWLIRSTGGEGFPLIVAKTKIDVELFIVGNLIYLKFQTQTINNLSMCYR